MRFSLLCATLLAAVYSPLALAAETGRIVLPFDRDWRFHLGDVAEGQKPTLDDAAWRKLDLPHDWMIEGAFDKKSPATHEGGYLNGGVGWYRKTFTLPPEAKGRSAWIEFDGAYMDADVWLNGKHLGNHPYGYTSFHYDLTPHLKFDGPNVLAMRLNVTQPCSRWYSGAGIYRHVRLVLTNPVHIATWQTSVTTPEVTKESADVWVATGLVNDGEAFTDVRLKWILLDPQGVEVAKDASDWGRIGWFHTDSDPSVELMCGWEKVRLVAPHPKFWSVERPQLYTAVTRLYVGKNMVDEVRAPFGIRDAKFTPEGFFLNGKRVQLNGVCDHHDLGCLGSAVHRRAIERQLEILKSMGCNAIRTSHNPPAPELLDLCDRMGFLVMDEAFDEWKQPKKPMGYGRFFDQWSEKDLVSMLHRDRNHPSIVLWSIGNEISEQHTANGGAMAKRLADICRREDPTRPVTSACNEPGDAERTGYAKALDVFGINYNIPEYQRFKGRPLVASETASALSTRGEYNLVPDKDGKLRIEIEHNHQMTSYDLGAPPWGCTAERSLLALAAVPWVAGEFVWTGFDYIGEPTPFTWPSRSSYFGIVDTCGFPKDRYYFYRARWRPEPLVHLLPHWTWPGWEGKSIPVWAATNCDAVELFLNGKSLGEKKLDAKKSLHVEWNVPYGPGTLKAIGKKAGRVVAEDEVRTVGKPARLVMIADRARIAADGDDLSFVTVKVVDGAGLVCPDAGQLVRYHLAGPGRIAGLDDGDPTNHESFQGSQHKVFHGLGLVVVEARRTGTITLRAEADGLEPAEIVLESVAEKK